MKKMIAVALCIVSSLGLPALSAQDAPPDAQPVGKSQTSLAAKDKAFAKIAADSSEVKAAKRAEDLETAKGLVGKTAAFVGNVDRVFHPYSNNLVLINFAREYKTAVVGVVRAPDFAKFPDLNALKGKRILITGKVTDFKGQPQVELTRLDGIKIVP